MNIIAKNRTVPQFRNALRIGLEVTRLSEEVSPGEGEPNNHTRNEALHAVHTIAKILFPIRKRLQRFAESRKNRATEDNRKIHAYKTQ